MTSFAQSSYGSNIANRCTLMVYYRQEPSACKEKDMNVAVLEKPQAIKISSKRQITIPAKIYEKAGFGDYALCTWTDKGMFPSAA